jgi:hypothetical protein
MTSKRSWLVILAFTVVLVAVIIGAAHSQQVSADGSIDPTCTSSNPCIEYDNNGSGPGIRGVGIGGNGLAGSTEFKSTSATNFREGLIGNDISTTGIFNAGVRGLSVRGTGVLGNSTSGSGVTATSTSSAAIIGTSTSSLGVWGISTNFTGVNGQTHGSIASSAGVQGTNNASTIAVRANGFGGPLFVGNNHLGLDTFTVDDGGNLTVGGNATVSGAETINGDQIVGGHAAIDGTPGSNTSLSMGFGSTQDYGVQVLGNIFGVRAIGSTAGIQGESGNSTATAVKGFGGGGFIFEGEGTALTDVFTVDNSGNVNAHSYSTGLAATSGKTMITYAPQASEPVVEDFGEAQLTNGSSYVSLEGRFASIMARGMTYLVFITPEGDTRGLYVTQKSVSGFAVRENQGGHSSVAFSYRIVGKPLGNQSPRLPVLVSRKIPNYALPIHSRSAMPMLRPRLNYVPKVRPTIPIIPH